MLTLELLLQLPSPPPPLTLLLLLLLLLLGVPLLAPLLLVLGYALLEGLEATSSRAPTPPPANGDPRGSSGRGT